MCTGTGIGGRVLRVWSRTVGVLIGANEWQGRSVHVLAAVAVCWLFVRGTWILWPGLYGVQIAASVAWAVGACPVQYGVSRCWYRWPCAAGAELYGRCTDCCGCVTGAIWCVQVLAAVAVYCGCRAVQAV